MKACKRNKHSVTKISSFASKLWERILNTRSATSKTMIRIYPNPSSPGDPLIIEGVQKGMQLRLYDLTGRLILEDEITIGRQILTSPTFSGMYFYTLLNEK